MESGLSTLYRRQPASSKNLQSKRGRKGFCFCGVTRQRMLTTGFFPSPFLPSSSSSRSQTTADAEKSLRDSGQTENGPTTRAHRSGPGKEPATTRLEWFPCELSASPVQTGVQTGAAAAASCCSANGLAWGVFWFSARRPGFESPWEYPSDTPLSVNDGGVFVFDTFVRLLLTLALARRRLEVGVVLHFAVATSKAISSA